MVFNENAAHYDEGYMTVEQVNLLFKTLPIDLTYVFSEEEILKAYDESLQPFMQKNGYKTADVINISESTSNLDAIRQKFLKEHTHTEDEVRFFVDGKGYFWFNINHENVFCVVCEKGD
ncbi:MAG: hypothetical protein LRY25_02450, partial [Flavobacterium sp.]|nr:hypothetical protein [Flavobacterium sp.]